MADNVKVDEGAGPAIATDDVGGAQHQKVKLEFGGDGTATPVETGTPLPVEDSDVATLLTGLGALLTAIEADTGPLAGLLTTIDADTSNLSTILTRLTEIEEDTDNLPAIKTAVELIDNVVSGSEMQVDVVGALPAGSSLIGDVGLGKRTSGGLSTFRSLDVDESEEAVKASAGQLYWIHFTNRAAAERHLKLYDGTTGEVTVGSTEPKHTFPLPEKAMGWVAIPHAIPFAKAITIAATTGIADNNSGAPAENDVVVNIGYA